MQVKLYKLMFDISVCYTIGAFLLLCIWDTSFRGLTFFALLCSAIISVLLETKPRWKTVSILILPAIAMLFLRPSIPEASISLLVWLYCSYVLIKDRLLVNRGELIDLLKKIMILFLLLILLMLTVFHNVMVALAAASPYFVAALVTAVFLLRHLRIDHHIDQIKGYRKQQLIELLAFLTICLLLTLVRAPQNILLGVKLFYHQLIVPILSLIAGVVAMLIRGILYLLASLYRLFTNPREVNLKGDEAGADISQLLNVPDVTITDLSWMQPIVYSLGIIAVVLLLFFLFRKLMGDRLRQQMPSDIMEKREYLEDTKDKKSASRRRRPKDSRAAVRYYYWKCLLWLQNRDVNVRPQDSSEEVYNKYIQMHSNATKVQQEPAIHFIDLYRKARYQLMEPLSEEDAQKAKKLYHTMTVAHRKKNSE
ncbi:MAG: hypothetical protein H6Q59_2143 [Firmicutes bacterium]|nr:hypothetical protein [Bacillota bacterium]